MKVGFITIGQSPRIDVVPEIENLLGNHEIVECGALDGLTMKDIQKLAPAEEDYLLVTRLRDGTEVKLSRDKVVKRLQECIERIERKVDIIGILCTGEFPELKSAKLLVEPSILLLKTVEALSVKKLGVIIPNEKQMELTKRKWSSIIEEVDVKSVSPYTGNEKDIMKAAEALKQCELIVLDCIGYNTNARRIVQEIAKKPVILPRTLMARIIGELLEG